MTAEKDVVEITAPCPECGDLAIWHGRRDEVRSLTKSGGGTVYDAIECPRCDRTWSLGEQIARRLERAGRISERTTTP